MTGEDLAQVVLFRLEDREFGFPLSVVAEVLPMVAITPVTGAPEWLPGAINLRGQTLPVADLRRRIGLPSLGADIHAAIVVTKPQGGDPIGFIVDRVLEVAEIPGDAVDAVGPWGGEEHPVEAFVRIGERMILILDVERLTTERRDLSLPEALP